MIIARCGFSFVENFITIGLLFISRWEESVICQRSFEHEFILMHFKLHLHSDEYWCVLLWLHYSFLTYIFKESLLNLCLDSVFDRVLWAHILLYPLAEVKESKGPNFIELLSTKNCLAWNFFLDKIRITNQISICCILLVTGIQLLFAYPEITGKFGW